MPIAPRILKTDAPKRLTLGIVYEPDVEDSQHDWATVETIGVAQRDFMKRLVSPNALTKVTLDTMRAALEHPDGVRVDVTELLDQVTKGVIGDQHATWDDAHGTVTQCFLAPVDMTIAGESVKKGAWLMEVEWSEEMFVKIQSGDRTGYSLGGWAKRKEAHAAAA